MSERAIRLAGNDAARWCELVSSIPRFNPEVRKSALEAVDTTLARLDEVDRSLLWGKLRDEVLRHERFRSAKWVLPEEDLKAIKTVVDLYAPNDPVVAVAPLFDSLAIDDDGNLETSRRRRIDALRALIVAAGIDALPRLAAEARM